MERFALLFFLLLVSPPPACLSFCRCQPFSSSSPSSAQRTASNTHPLPESPTPETTSSGRDRQFKAATHEVPSGPNPESNK
ncbi:hypothetical protein F3Y22_tig00110044pilonHSYRG00168 [Hibiscus syriacus]|uniref:Secreted protein n=1 Tax=Hibiscus syriacus TaxID=106335 RepID=A0A6A3BRP6_HIBSY|nr:hypothetical protein F3Y22_tig00110044pilonHSYRG00168 [Hibiscus syriacus]